MESTTSLTPTDSITITVSHRGSSYPITIPCSAPFSDLQATVEQLTNVPASHQKLIYKGKRASKDTSGNESVADAGFKDGLKVMLIGGTKEEIGEMQQKEDEARQRARIDRERRARPQAKIRSTRSSTSTSNQYKFHLVHPHALLPSSTEALSVLNRLAEDPAICHIMQLHKFSVGLLTEFAPHEHPDKLGYNTNKGQVISLRIRTNLYDGFRPYLNVRQVLLHELAHNVWSDHNNNFKELNSQLNREVLEYEHVLKTNTHTLGNFEEIFEPSELEATSFVLGGSGGRNEEGAEARRQRVLDAVMARLKREEEELEDACGNTTQS